MFFFAGRLNEKKRADALPTRVFKCFKSIRNLKIIAGNSISLAIKILIKNDQTYFYGYSSTRIILTTQNLRKKQLILAKIQNIIYISPKQEIFDFESTWNEKETSISEKVPLVITSEIT